MKPPTYTRDPGRTPGHGMPVASCDRCGVRMGIRAQASHTAAHRRLDAGWRTSPRPVVRNHMNWIATAGGPGILGP